MPLPWNTDLNEGVKNVRNLTSKDKSVRVESVAHTASTQLVTYSRYGHELTMYHVKGESGWRVRGHEHLTPCKKSACITLVTQLLINRED
jgi:hypothetical protein